MKALSLTQPWGTLVAIGAKRIETRSWSTKYRGTIAIHAAKEFPKDAQQLCGRHPFHEPLERAGVKFYTAGVKCYTLSPEHWYYVPSYYYRGGLPLGAIVAVADLRACERVEEILRIADTIGGLLPHEREFGDYQEGRYVWLLYDVRRLPEPIHCRGALGLWTVPADVQQQIEAQIGVGV